jgi:hypothetical protein
MTRLDSLAFVTIAASLALYAGPMLTGAVSGQRSAVSDQRSAISVQRSAEHSSVQDAAPQAAAQTLAQDASSSPDLAQDAPVSGANQWLSTLQAATYTFDKPLVLIVGDAEYATAVRDALGPDEADFAWRRTEGAERSVGVLKSRDSDLLECSETEPAKVAELLRALE